MMCLLCSEEEEEEEEEEASKEKAKETVWEWELLNDAKPIWLRSPGDVSEEEYAQFYHAISKVSPGPNRIGQVSAAFSPATAHLLVFSAPKLLQQPAQILIRWKPCLNA